MKKDTESAFILSENSEKRKATGARARAREKANKDQRRACAAADRLLVEPQRAARVALIDSSPVDPIQRASARAEWSACDFSAHVQAWARVEQAREDLARAKRYETARAAGPWDIVSMSPLGEDKKSAARAAMDQAESRNQGGILRGLRAAETRAAAGRVLSLGLLGRALARAARLGESSGMRWLRQHSRREALALSEVGAAAGVDDLRAGEVWGHELMAISSAVHKRAAVYGCALVGAPLGPCRELVARGLTGGAGDDLRAAVLGRGRRVDGAPVVEWTNKGRTVRADSIGILGRGCAWVWAARQASKEMHAARYGLGGRDGREVWAGWSVIGNAAAPSAVESGRSPSAVAAIRDELAAGIVSARAGLARARAAASLAITPCERAKAGGDLGRARRTLDAARKAARTMRAALGNDFDPATVESFFEESGAISDAGRKFAERMRAALPVSARLTRQAAIA